MEQVRCLGCMKPKTSRPICEHCGWDETGGNSPHQLPAGTVLNRQYVVGRALGQGGFGITYLGWDLYLDIPIAIKEYYPNGMVSREPNNLVTAAHHGEAAVARFQKNRDRFLREAKALARFSDIPEIVHIRNFFQANGTAYIVMEYLNGINLREYIQRKGGKLTVPETFEILRPIMEALARVHDTGLIHRDISPENIMMLARGGAKLLDFGSVRDIPDASAAMTSTEPVVKPNFAPVEQYQRRGNLGPWTDVYALCATIYHCLTGQNPVDAPTRMIRFTDMDWDQIPGLTPRQAEALRRGSALMPQDRISSVRELAQQLFDAPAQPLPPGPEPGTPPATPDLPGQPSSTVIQSAGDNVPSRRIPLLLLALLLSAALVAVYFTVHIWTGPSCESPRTCLICGKATDDPALGHDWVRDQCGIPHTCARCGKTEGEVLNHFWMDANCEQPRRCIRCGAQEGEALGHTWQDATYDLPQTCTRCGATEGQVLGYIGDVGGSWSDKNMYFTGSPVPVYELDQTLTDCIHMLFHIQVEAESGDPYTEWTAFGRKPDGTWIQLGSFELTEDTMAIPLDFSTPVTIDAISAAFLTPRSGNYTVSVALSDVQVLVD